MHTFTKALAALTLGAITIYHLSRKKKTIQLPAGESTYFLPEKKGACQDAIPVYYFRPATWTEEQPVFIAFPGYTRNAKGFAKRLEELAVKYNMLIACPEFSTKKYPGACCYQEGNMSDADDTTGHIQERKDWNFDTVDRLVLAIRKRTHAKGKVLLFGHSAGGQFMHRYSLFSRNCPYGMKDLPVTDKDLARAFARPVTMLMGSLDISRKKPFRDTPEADAQGLNRMERCTHYFHSCQKKAQELHVPFRWQLQVVEDTAHEGGKMAEGAMKLFCEEPLDDTVGM